MMDRVSQWWNTAALLLLRADRGVMICWSSLQHQLHFGGINRTTPVMRDTGVRMKSRVERERLVRQVRFTFGAHHGALLVKA